MQICIKLKIFGNIQYGYRWIFVDKENYVYTRQVMLPQVAGKTNDEWSSPRRVLSVERVLACVKYKIIFRYNHLSIILFGGLNGF